MSTLVAHSPSRLTEPTEGRGRLRLLDRVLNELEEESERGETTVSDELAKRAGCLVAGIVPDALIRDAIDLVFLEQERTLAPSSSESLHLSSRRKEPKVFAAPDTSLESGEARTLTERIRQRLGNLSLLLLQAHDRRAWSALGYRTWEAYVQDELGLSRSRSYELLQHGRVMTALHVAGITAGVTAGRSRRHRKAAHARRSCCRRSTGRTSGPWSGGVARAAMHRSRRPPASGCTECARTAFRLGSLCRNRGYRRG
jgi:hypothetical protein